MILAVICILMSCTGLDFLDKLLVLFIGCARFVLPSTIVFFVLRSLSFQASALLCSFQEFSGAITCVLSVCPWYRGMKCVG